MKLPYRQPFWKVAPLSRLLLLLVAGIIVQWYLSFSLEFVLVCIASISLALIATAFLKSYARFYARKLIAALLLAFVFIAGMGLTWQKDVRHRADWYGRYLKDSSWSYIRIDEPLIEKSRSYKADGKVMMVKNEEELASTGGKVLLYFARDSAAPALHYGDIILVHQNFQRIKNSGNPGGFNYQRYAAFQGLYHQLFLQPNDWQATGKSSKNFFRQFLFDAREFVIHALQKYIPNTAQQLGIAEALLIGYKEDLDKDLVQAYSNTGVVHIIAISGLHLGLIFVVLSWLFNHAPWLRRSRHVRVVLLICGLWLFALLTGGSASVLRSAVMFTVVIIGKNYFRQSSVYNSLSASALLLLCYNPYLLWDVGFQLSYLAVIGIIALQQPLYRSLYIRQRFLRKVWEMTSITLAAQVAAFPICLYYFHQFPNMFLFTNLLAVPLSTVILFGEILLVMLSLWSPAALLLGKFLGGMLWLMNSAVLWLNSFSFSVLDNVYADVLSTLLLYAAVACLCAWLLHRRPVIAKFTLFFLAAFGAFHTYARVQLNSQKKIVIYNVSRCRAVDFLQADYFSFIGDSALRQEGLLQNFHLKPARIFYRAKQEVPASRMLRSSGSLYRFCNTSLLMIDTAVMYAAARDRIPVDILLLSHNAKVRLQDLVTAVSPAVVVFDASNSLWKIEKWKSECEDLHLRFHSVPEQGAFVKSIP